MSDGFLFEPEAPARPLADRMRPETLEEVAGQDHLLGEFFPLEWTVLVITLVDEYMSPAI